MTNGGFRELVGVAPRLREPGHRSWDAVEEWVGVGLPEDFKEFVGLYGDGLVAGHLAVPHPEGVDPMVDFMRRGRRKLAAVLPDYVEDVGQLDFDPAGLVPWGYSNWDGDDCLLVPRDGGEWDILVVFRQLACVRLYEGGFTRFIAGVLSERELPPGWPVFEPAWAPIEGSPLG